MENKNLSEYFNKLYRDFIKYIELKFELLKIEFIELVVNIYSKLISIIVAGAFLTLVVIFLFIALSLYLGELWGHLYLGFLATGGGLLLLFFIFLIFKNNLITNPLLQIFIQIFFNLNKEYRNGKKKISKRK